jgi:prepilin signal peptidase PulO-like enzyme (type II secretory pathway)
MEVIMGYSGILFFIIFAIPTILILVYATRSTSGYKIMLLGIHITLLGGIIAIDPDSNLEGFEYLIVLVGLIFSIIGAFKKELK